MSIQTIAKLKSFGVFREYSWPTDLPAFKRFNLVYGWNRSGKTTLSRVFAACEKRSIGFDQYPEGGQFEVVTESNVRVKSDDLESCSLAVRIFNKDFVDDNISFEPSTACNPIIQVSEEDIEGEKKLKAARLAEEERIRSYDSAKKAREAAEKVDESFLSSTALAVKQNVADYKVRDQYYAYDKSQLKQTLAATGLEGFVQLPEQKVKDYKPIIVGEAKPRLTAFATYAFQSSIAGVPVSSFSDVTSALNKLIEKRVVSEMIDRLKGDQDLNSWVARGLELHKQNEAKECLFCEKPLDTSLLDRLSRHFSVDYEDLQKSIEKCLVELEDLRLERLIVPADVYPELKSACKAQIDDINSLTTDVNKWLDQAKKSLIKKRDNPLAVVGPLAPPPEFGTSYDKLITSLNKVIAEHNLKVDNHEAEVKDKKDQLAGHFISEAISQQGYSGIRKDLDAARKNESEALKLLKEKQAEVAELQKRTSSIGRALGQINQYIEEFFGRKEIQLELDLSQRGYMIQRDGETACNLSEGEKTAIAFSYFLVKVEEAGFRKQDGVIVVDDPISSFDSNFVFHCFSLIKNHFGRSGQLIVLTHNFELFNLVKSWFCSMKKRDELCGFYMIENSSRGGERYADLCLLEDTLLKYRSEYHYLFVKLSEFATSGQPKYDDLYTISNVARRFLEIFASFKIPTTGDLASKLDQLVKDGSIDGVQKDKVYKLINEYSHGPDPTSAIEHKDKVEAQEAVRIALKIVENADSRHYELLAKNVSAA